MCQLRRRPDRCTRIQTGHPRAEGAAAARAARAATRAAKDTRGSGCSIPNALKDPSCSTKVLLSRLGCDKSCERRGRCLAIRLACVSARAAPGSSMPGTRGHCRWWTRCRDSRHQAGLTCTRAARAEVATEGPVATSEAAPAVESWKGVVVMARQPQHRASAAIAAGSHRPGPTSAIPS